MLLKKLASAALLLLSIGFGLTGCLRFKDQPQAWPCGDDGDCRSGETCYGTSTASDKKCRPIGYCERDAECGTLQGCQNHVCAAVACTDSAPQACAPFACETNLCLTHCTSSQDCDQDHSCRAGACLPHACTPQNAIDKCSGFACSDQLCLTKCGSSFDCAGNFQCQQGVCVLPPQPAGESCVSDAQCQSRQCCPASTLNTHTCADACTLRSQGEACTWNDVCASHLCNGQVCVPCTTKECFDATCGSRTCGMVNGVSCGSCPAREYCTADGACADACGSKQCGSAQGVSCGDCSGSNYCSEQATCDDACAGLSCGDSHGVSCGTCSGETFCGSAHSCQAWSDCGIGNGVSKAGTATTDRSCTPCASGWFSTQINQACRQWSGLCIGVEALPPNSTRDRVCYDGWDLTYGTRFRGQEAWSLVLLSGNDALVGGAVGTIDDPPVSNIDEHAYLRRISQVDGSVLWERQFGTTSLNRVLGLSVAPSGYVYAAGYTYSNVGAGVSSNGDAFVMKVAAVDGSVSWTQGFGTTAFDYATAVATDPAGNALVVGSSAGALGGPRVATGNGSDVFAFKVSSVDGSVLWKTQFGPGSGNGVSIDAAGDVVVAARASVVVPAAEGAGMFTVRKLSGSTGAEIWTQRFGTTSNDTAQAVTVDSNNDILVSGIADPNQLVVMRLAAGDGHRLWSKTFGIVDTVLNSTQGISLTAHGTVLVTGTAASDIDGEGEPNDAFLFELNATDGSVLWSEGFGWPYREHARATAMDASGSIWVSGERDVDRNLTTDGATRANSFVAKIIRPASN